MYPVKKLGILLVLICFSNFLSAQSYKTVPGDTFGYTQGTFNVSDAGTVLYTIPIISSPGTSGFQPSVGLLYNSQGGNGLVGLGFSIQGLSAISRASQTTAQDGKTVGVNFTSSDRFALDGERLVITNSSLIYGANSTEYRTEQNAFNRIISYGNLGNNTPAYFKVFTNAGLIMEYGNTTDSRIDAGGTKAIYWLINKVSDRKGNYYTVKYEQDPLNGEYYPIRIDYTGNDNTGLQPSASIRFEYEARFDVTNKYLNGIQFSGGTKRLAAIKSYFGNKVIRSYYLKYQYSPAKLSQLVSIKECGKNNKCFPATVFTWENVSKPSFSTKKISGVKVTSSSDNLTGLDLNGDGVQDIVKLTQNENIEAFISNKDLANLDFQSLVLNPVIRNDAKLATGDFNGDGLVDMFKYDPSTGTNIFYLNAFEQGSSKVDFNVFTAQIINTVFSKYSTVLTLDFNGDGRTDLLLFDPLTGKNYWFLSNIRNKGSIEFIKNGSLNYFTDLIPSYYFTGYSEPFFNDYNGDGLLDVLMLYNASGNTHVYINDGGNTLKYSLITKDVITPASIAGTDITLTMPDINADGLADIMAYRKSDGKNQWWINKGNFTFISTTAGPANLASLIKGGDKLLNLDFNADGYADLVWVDKITGQNQWFLNDGNLNFIKQDKSLIDSNEFKNYDLQGVGNYSSASTFDFYASNLNVSANKIKVFQGVSSVNNMVTGITIGNGQKFEIKYELITSDNVYDKHENAVYPLMDFQATQFVVQSYKTDNGIGGKSTVSYTYAGAKVDLKGRGFRGFAEVHIKDENTGIIQSKFYLSDSTAWKYLNSPLIKTTTRLSNGVIISQTDITNGLKSYYNGTCHYSYVSKNSSKSYEIDGTFVDSTVTTQAYDDFGNVIMTVTDYGDGHKDSLTNIFRNDVQPWILGRLLKSQLFRIAPNQKAIVKSCAFDYDFSGGTGLLINEISEPDSGTTRKIVKNYVYDAYGNIIKSSITAWNGKKLETRAKNLEFDSLGRFVTSTSNILGHKVTKTYDPELGSLLSETTINDQTARYTYDDFGRLIQTIYPDGNWVSSDIRRCGNDFNCPPNSHYIIYKQSSVAPASIEYYDLFNRLIRSESIGFNGNQIYTDVEFDSRGLVIKQSNPYFSKDNAVFTEFRYDISGRKTITIEPGNRTDSVLYNGRKTTYINALGQKSIILKDAKDQVISVFDNQDNELKFSYDAAGNLLKTTDPNGNTIISTYDRYGNKTKLTDPDLGTYVYQTNSFGEVIKQIDAKNNVLTLEYDSLGRIITRTEPEGKTTWEYDKKFRGKGLVSTIKGYDGYTLNLEYDSLSRITKETQVIAGESYVQKYQYDKLGRLEQTTYPSGFAVTNKYNTNGYLSEIINTTSKKSYWKALSQDAFTRYTAQQYGNGTQVHKTYNVNTNLLTNINTIYGQVFLQQQEYIYDAIGNMLQRKDKLQNKAEDFIYDDLNRLLHTQVRGEKAVTMTYDVIGNITSKSDIGTYTYGNTNAGPHQVQSIKLTTSQCIPSLLVSTEVNSFNKVNKIANDTAEVLISYNPNRQRSLQKMYVQGKLYRTKTYVSSLFEKEVKNGDTILVNYVFGPEGVIAVHTQNKNTSTLKYLHRDNLGSVVLTTNDKGAVTGRFSFDAWGKRRNANWSSILTDTNSLSNDRGFTGHEHYDLFELVDMNGRMYDPTLARFTSADPFIQFPYNLQSYNRYSYVLNNPLIYTDPSGFFLGKLFGKAINWSLTEGVRIAKEANKAYNSAGKWVKQNWKTIAVIAVTITVASLTGPAAGALAPSLSSIIFSGAAAGFAGGATATLLSGGNMNDALKAGIKGAVIGGATSGLTHGVGDMAHAASTSTGSAYSGIAVKVVGHGIVQGGASEANGGKFESGFYVGAISGGTNQFIGNINSKAGQIAAAAVVGGTTSEIAGGTFSNGATAAAFTMMYNDWAHDYLKASYEMRQEGQYDKYDHLLNNSSSTAPMWRQGNALTHNGRGLTNYELENYERNEFGKAAYNGYSDAYKTGKYMYDNRPSWDNYVKKLIDHAIRIDNLNENEEL